MRGHFETDNCWQMEKNVSREYVTRVMPKQFCVLPSLIIVVHAFCRKIFTAILLLYSAYSLRNITDLFSGDNKEWWRIYLRSMIQKLVKFAQDETSGIA